jgi:hypothetical protein
MQDKSLRLAKAQVELCFGEMNSLDRAGANYACKVALLCIGQTGWQDDRRAAFLAPEMRSTVG